MADHNAYHRAQPAYSTVREPGCLTVTFGHMGASYVATCRLTWNRHWEWKVFLAIAPTRRFGTQSTTSRATPDELMSWAFSKVK